MAQRAERKLFVDAGVGDPDAPIGTEAWAQHMRLRLESKIIHVHEEPESLGRTLDLLVEQEAWKLLHKPDGTKFRSLEEYCHHRRPWGLGMSPAEIARRVSIAATGQRFKALVAPDQKPEEIALTIEQAKALPVHPAAALLPMLDEANLVRLVADIAEHGLRNPLVLFDGQLLDGRNRLTACERAGVEPRAVTLVECASPAAYVLSANLHRRHLDATQLAMVGGRLVESGVFEAEAKARQSGGQGGVLLSADLREANGKTSELAASLLSVSPRSVESAVRVLRAVPELAAAVDRGEVTVAAAATIVTLPHDEQKAHVEAGTVKQAAKEIREARKAERKAKAEPEAERLERAILAAVDMPALERLWGDFARALADGAISKVESDHIARVHRNRSTDLRKPVDPLALDEASDEQPKPSRKREARIRVHALADELPDHLIERAKELLEALARGEVA